MTRYVRYALGCASLAGASILLAPGVHGQQVERQSYKSYAEVLPARAGADGGRYQDPERPQ